MADVKKLAEELTKLTVLEVNELKNVLKDEYGIEPAAAAVAVAGPAAGAEAGAAADEKTEFTVTLKAAGAQKVAVIKPSKRLVLLSKSRKLPRKKDRFCHFAKNTPDFGVFFIRVLLFLQIYATIMVLVMERSRNGQRISSTSEAEAGEGELLFHGQHQKTTSKATSTSLEG